MPRTPAPLRLIALLSALLFLVSCSSTPKDGADPDTKQEKDTQTIAPTLPSPLPESADMGQGYIDSFIFLGESTTYHLKNRGVLSGGTNTTQVWGPKSGTLMLDLNTASCRIVYPETDEELDLCRAMSQKKPRYLLLTFGLNGATASISRGEEYFKKCYSRLISSLSTASPQTVILLQSCFPIAKSMDMSGYSVDVATLNGYIDTINGWTRELADSLSLGYLATAEALKDKDGFLLESYQVGDGYHLTREAYIVILDYIRTHGYTREVDV